MKKVITIIVLSAIMLSGYLAYSSTRYETKTTGTKSSVVYGKNNGSIVAIKVLSDGSIYLK